MSIYQRKDSRFWWMWLRRGIKPESTGIDVVGATTFQTRRNKRLAEEAYHARMADLARARYQLPSAEPEERRRFTDQCDWYTQYKVPTLKSESSREREAGIVAMLRKRFGRLALEEIDRELAAEWARDRLAQASPTTKRKPTVGTVNRELDVLKAVLQSAVPKYLKVSPLRGMKRLRPANDDDIFEPRLLTREEEKRLLRQLAPDDRALLLCALDSLTRLGDALNLRRDQSGPVQDRGTYLLLLNPKNGKRKKKPISKRLRLALDRVPDRGPYYFHRRRVAKTERDRRGAVRDFLAAACKRCDPPIPYGRKRGGITFHTATKHTGASRMINEGKVHPRVIQDIGEWSRADILTRYTHPDGESLTAAVAAVAASPSAPPRAEDRIDALERELVELRKKKESEAAANRQRLSVVK